MADRPTIASVPQSQSELEFFDLALDLMVIVGFDGNYKRVNPAYERTLGYPPGVLLSRPFLEFVHPEDLPSLRDVFGELVDGDRNDVIGFENRVICGDASVRWLEWNTRTMPERGVVFGVGRDVTDRRRADAELREAHRMVAASRDELARLAEEQTALQRVATLVAHGTSQEELGGFHRSSQHLDVRSCDGPAGGMDEGAHRPLGDEVAGQAIASTRGRAVVLA